MLALFNLGLYMHAWMSAFIRSVDSVGKTLTVIHVETCFLQVFLFLAPNPREFEVVGKSDGTKVNKVMRIRQGPRDAQILNL